MAAYAADWFPAHNLKPHPRRVYGLILRKHVLPALGGEALADVGAAHIRAWFRRLEADGASAALMHAIKSVASAMFQTAAEDGLISANPVRGIKVRSAPQARRKALTVEQFRAVLAAVPEHYRLMLLAMVSTGLRWEELTALRGTDLDGQVINVRHVLQELWGPHRFELRDGTKNGKARRVKASQELSADLAALGTGFLFKRPDGGHISQPNFRRDVWRPALAAAGVEGITVRDLRRTHATWLRQGGASLEAVRDRLGHGNVAVTDRYLAEDPRTADEALTALSAVMNAA